MKIITQCIYRKQGNPAQVKKLEGKLKSTQADLNSILTEWSWGGQPITTAKDFLNKMGPWIKTRNEEKEEVKNFLKKHQVKSLASIVEVKTKGG